MLQAISGDFIAVRCNGSTVVLTNPRGRIRTTIKRVAPGPFPTPLVSKDYALMWSSGTVYGHSTKDGKRLWSTRLPVGFTVASIAPGPGIAAVTGVGNDTIYIIRARYCIFGTCSHVCNYMGRKLELGHPNICMTLSNVRHMQCQHIVQIPDAILCGLGQRIAKAFDLHKQPSVLYLIAEMADCCPTSACP